MVIVWFWNWLHSFSAPDMTMTYDDVIDTLASIVVLMLVPNFPPMPTARTSTQLLIVKSRGGNDRRYNLYQYTKSVQR